VVGLAALLRSVRKRQHQASAPATGPGTDPAEELRSALAETKAEEPPSPAAPEEPPSLEERRRKVHERAQEAIDAMNDPPAGA
jgi:hypothetical protein